MEIAEQFYSTSSDPGQIPITEESFRRLMSIHKETIKLKADKDGNPVSWVVVVPTSKKIMELFLDSKISEKELFDKAVQEKRFEALYLCSGFTLPEFRNTGYAMALFTEAINEFAKDDSVALYAWLYSKEGEGLFNKAKNLLNREVRVRK